MPHQTIPSSAPHEALYTQVRDWKHCDVLIDRMAGFPFQDELTVLNNQTVHQFTLADPLFVESPEQAPLLVRLPWTEMELLEKFLTFALQETSNPGIQTRQICAFLFSSLEQATLGRRLTKRLDVSVQTVGNIYFRYFDPRVTRHLPRILDQGQLSALLDGVQTWLYVDWTGQLDAITPQQPRPAASRFTLTAAQWRQMQGIESFNLALRLLQQTGFLNDKPEAETETRVLAAVHDADATGLIVPEDQATFAAYALKFGAAFKRHPGLLDAINAAVQHDVPLADALAHYTGIMPDTTSLPSASHQ